MTIAGRRCRRNREARLHCKSWTLRAMLRWAAEQELIARAPIVRVRTEETPRSRGITLEEFERILLAVPKIRPDDAPRWDRLLRGQWHCGFRISEVVELSWDADAPIHLERLGRFPVVSLASRSHKSRKRKIRPISPEFWAVCCETPEAERRGLVFPIPTRRGTNMTLKTIVRTISAIGTKAGVITNPETGKLATSHDTRRAFIGSLCDKLGLADAQKWTGPGDIRTILAYYHTRTAEELAAKLWPETGAGASGTLGGAERAPTSEPSKGE
jgi:integrase